MTEADEYFQEIQPVLDELDNEYQHISINKNDMQAIKKFDRKARNIENAIHDYEIHIQDFPQHNHHHGQIEELKIQYQSIMALIHEDPQISQYMVKSTIHKNQPKFTPIVDPQSQQPGMMQQTPQPLNNRILNNNDIQLDISSSVPPQRQFSQPPMGPNINMGGFQANNGPHQTIDDMPVSPNLSRIMNQPASPVLINQQSGKNINIPMKQEVLNTDIEMLNTEANFQPQVKLDRIDHSDMKNIVGSNYVGRKCSAETCKRQTEAQCYKCRVWVCNFHTYRDQYEKKHSVRMEKEGIDIKKRRRQYCRDCGKVEEGNYLSCRYVASCLFCTLLIAALAIIIYVYLPIY